MNVPKTAMSAKREVMTIAPALKGGFLSAWQSVCDMSMYNLHLPESVRISLPAAQKIPYLEFRGIYPGELTAISRTASACCHSYFNPTEEMVPRTK